MPISKLKWTGAEAKEQVSILNLTLRMFCDETIIYVFNNC